MTRTTAHAHRQQVPCRRGCWLVLAVRPHQLGRATATVCFSGPRDCLAVHYIVLQPLRSLPGGVWPLPGLRGLVQ